MFELKILDIAKEYSESHLVKSDIIESEQKLESEMRERIKEHRKRSRYEVSRLF